jgi:hypothetical protein
MNKSGRTQPPTFNHECKKLLASLHTNIIEPEPDPGICGREDAKNTQIARQKHADNPCEGRQIMLAIAKEPRANI